MNPYLKSLRDQYAAIQTSTEGLKTRAASENRDLTEAELGSVEGQRKKAEEIFGQIELLTADETRNRKVAEMALQATPEGEQTETRSTGTTSAQDRDPGHYRKAKEGGKHSYFRDVYRAEQGDRQAAQRLSEHNRALTSVDEGPGLIPPKWMSSEFADIQRQTRRVASAVRNITITDPAPMSLPKQSVEAGTIVEQTTEETATTFTDGYDTTVTTVSPKLTAGGQKVTRQFLDSSNPAIDELIWQDLVASYDTKVEAKVVAAMVTAAGTAQFTYATEAAYTTAITNASGDTPIVDDLIDTMGVVRNARKLPANILVSSVLRYTSFLKMRDTTGRPLMPQETAGPMNVHGTGSVAVDGRLLGLGVIASDGITQYPESILVARAEDTILFESPIHRFKYEEPEGPEIIRIGIWAYTAVHVKYTSSVERLVITAA